jgi:hypothetical protein
MAKIIVIFMSGKVSRLFMKHIALQQKTPDGEIGQICIQARGGAFGMEAGTKRKT